MRYRLQGCMEVNSRYHGIDSQETGDEVGVELGAGSDSDFPERLRDRLGRGIGSVRAHGVEGIGDGDDSTQERDRFPRDPVRVPAAIPSFVV